MGQAVAGTNAGLFTIRADGSYSFDPNGAFNDLAVGASRDTSVTYQISDGQGSTSTATLTVTVTGTNDAPTVVQPVADQSARDGDGVRLATAGAFADVDRGDVLSYSVAGLPAGLSIDAATGLISGTLDRSASQVNGGRYAVTVTATDNNGAQVSDSFNYVVTNPVPVAVDDTATTSENADVAGSVLANDRDGAGDTDPLTVDRVNGQAEAVGRGVAGSAGGVFTINADGSYTFDPGADFDALAVGQSATSRVGYRISDGQGGSDTAQLTVTVTGTNDAPTVARALDDLSASNTETITIPTADSFADVDTGDTLALAAELGVERHVEPVEARHAPVPSRWPNGPQRADDEQRRSPPDTADERVDVDLKLCRGAVVGGTDEDDVEVLEPASVDGDFRRVLLRILVEAAFGYQRRQEAALAFQGQRRGRHSLAVVIADGQRLESDRVVPNTGRLSALKNDLTLDTEGVAREANE